MFIRWTIRARTLLLGVGSFGVGAILLWRPEAAAGGVSLGMSMAATVVLPTLFPFLVLGAFLSKSGLATVLGSKLEGVVRRIFGLPGCCAAVLLIGFLGGYPAGGAMVGELIRSHQLSREDGERVLRFCVCGGPGFIISTVGVSLMGSISFGALLYAAQLIAALIIGMVSRRATSTAAPAPSIRRISASSAFVDAVTASCQAALSMCGFLVLFASLLSIWNTTPFADNATFSLILSCITEVTCGCVAAVETDVAAPLLLGFAVGFGGLSVHCQLSALLRGTGAMTSRFFVWRTVHGGLTALLFVLLLQLIPIPQPVVSVTSSVVPFSTNVGMSACLLAVCGIWLLYVDKNRPVHYNKW